MKKEVAERENEIKAKVNEAAKNTTKSEIEPNRSTKAHEASSYALNPGGPAPWHHSIYNPWSSSWFHQEGFKWLWPVSLHLARWISFDPVEQPLHYSDHDERLCCLPEGWSITKTMAPRGAIN